MSGAWRRSILCILELYLRSSFRPANLGILPSQRNVPIVSAVVDVRAVVVTDFRRLMFGDGNRGCGPDARVRLFRFWIWHSVQARLASVPEIPVQRDPQAQLEIVAEVPLKRRHRIFGLRSCTWKLLIVREKLRIRCVEPGGSVRIHYPVPPSLRIPDLGFERPAVVS